LLTRRSVIKSAIVLAAAPLVSSRTLSQTSTSQRRSEDIPTEKSLYPEYKELSLITQAQRGDTCWAYSVLGCLELELSRTRKRPTPLSGFYLAWAAARSDRDTFDGRGSNFGRAARALERFGIADLSAVPSQDEKQPLDTQMPLSIQKSAALLARGLQFDWIRLKKDQPGFSAEEMTAVKRRLADGHPVAVGMRWPKNLTVEDASLCLLGTCRSLDETMDGHCVTLVGYQDNAHFSGGGTFIIRNTWGPDWMRDGYGRMSYSHISSFANDAISFSVEPSSKYAITSDLQPPHNTTDRAVFLPHASQCRVDSGLRVNDDDIGRFKRGVWQSDHQIFCNTDAPRVGFEFDVSVPESGQYTLSIAGTKAPDYGIWQARLDGEPVGHPLDFVWPNVEPTGELVIGSVSLAAGKHVIRLECKGKTIASAGYRLGLNWVHLRQRKRLDIGMAVGGRVNTLVI
jgi:hypothetical protein